MDEIQDYDFIKPQEEHLKDLMLKAEQDLVNAKVQEWIYQCEYAKPTNIGKQQALEGLAIYQKRVRFLQENLQVYEKYLTDHNLGIVI